MTLDISQFSISMCTILQFSIFICWKRPSSSTSLENFWSIRISKAFKLSDDDCQHMFVIDWIYQFSHNKKYLSAFIYLCLYIGLITVYLNYLFAVNPIPTAIATVVVVLYNFLYGCCELRRVL